MSVYAFWCSFFFAFAAFTVAPAVIAVKGVGEIRVLSATSRRSGER